MAEAYDNWAPKRSHCVSEGSQVGVILPSRYSGQWDMSRIYLHQCTGAMAGGRLGETLLERFPPAAVIGDEVRLPAHFMTKLRYLRVRMRCTGLKHAEITYLGRPWRHVRRWWLSGQLEACDHGRGADGDDSNGHRAGMRTDPCHLPVPPVPPPPGRKPGPQPRHTSLLPRHHRGRDRWSSYGASTATTLASRQNAEDSAKTEKTAVSPDHLGAARTICPSLTGPGASVMSIPTSAPGRAPSERHQDSTFPSTLSVGLRTRRPFR